MQSYSSLTLVSLSTLLLSGSALAQQPADTTKRDSSRTRLEAVRVVAERVPVATTVGGVSVVAITPDSLRLTPAAALGDVLREMPFVLVRQNSRGEQELSIRGSEARQSAVLLDRVPLTLGWDSRTDPSLIPMSGARTIAVVRGLSSLLQGPNVLGGVVSIDINSGESDDTDTRSVELRSGADHTGAGAVNLSFVSPFYIDNGKLTLRTGGGFRNSAGFALSGRVADPTARHDRRTNSDAEQVDGYLAMRYTTGNGPWVGLSATGYRAERGVPPELHLSEPRLWRYPDASRLLAIGSAGTGRVRTPWGSGDAEVVVGVNDGRTEIESFTSMDYDVVDGRERDHERTTTARLLADHSLGRGELRTAFTWAQVRFREQIDADPASRYEQRLWSMASEVEQPLPKFWRVTAGIAYDGSDTPETGGKPSLGRLTSWATRVGVSTLAFNAGARFHASMSRRSRFAALRELYSGSLGRFEPNPSLRPERITGFETGLTFMRSTSQLQTVLFHNRLEDAVTRISTPEGKFKRVNRDQMRSTGLEVLGSVTAGELLVSGDFMVQQVRLHDPVATGTARRPEHVPEFQTGASVTAPFIAGSRATVGMNYTGQQFCVNPDLGRTVRLGGQAKSDIGVEREWQVRSAGMLSRVRGMLAIDNVTDRAIYSQCGLPDPGRTIRVGMSLR